MEVSIIALKSAKTCRRPWVPYVSFRNLMRLPVMCTLWYWCQIAGKRVWQMVPSIFVLALVHLMYSCVSSGVELKSRIGYWTSLIYIPPDAIMADSILAHQLDQLVPVTIQSFILSYALFLLISYRLILPLSCIPISCDGDWCHMTSYLMWSLDLPWIYSYWWCRSCMLSTVVEGVFPSIHRSSIIIWDSIITFHSNLNLSMYVWCISTLSISIGYSGFFHFFLYCIAIIHFIYI